MSSLRAIELPLARTEPVVALPTDAYRRPRPREAAPAWEQRVEAGVRAVGRFGLGPIPAFVVGFAVLVSVTLH